MSNLTERWAQALVANGLDVLAAWPIVYPVSEGKAPSKFKSDKKKLAYFGETFANLPGLWQRVAELQKPVDEQIAVRAADVLNYWKVVATTDRRKLVQIVEAACRCGGDEKCPYCGGKGTLGAAVQVAPTASYDADAAMIFEGAEETKYGVKVHMAERSKAWEMLARNLGMFNDKLLLARDGEPPELPPLPDDPVEAARLYAEWVKK